MSKGEKHLFHTPFHAEAKSESFYREQKAGLTKESTKKTGGIKKPTSLKTVKTITKKVTKVTKKAK